jgi:chromate transporter
LSAGARDDEGGGPTLAPRSPREMFVAFTVLALQGFGGVLPVAQRELVDKRRWLTHEQFLEVLSVGQVLPGPNVVNISLMVGDRFFGWRGAMASLAGILSAPTVIVLTLAALYTRFAAEPALAGAVRGMGAASVSTMTALERRRG